MSCARSGRNPRPTPRNWLTAFLIVCASLVLGLVIIRILNTNVSVRCERVSTRAGHCTVTSYGPAGLTERVFPLQQILRASVQYTSPTLMLHTTEGDVAIWYGSNWRNLIGTQRQAADGINGFLADRTARDYQIELGEDLGTLLIGLLSMAGGTAIAVIYLKDAQHKQRRLGRRF